MFDEETESLLDSFITELMEAVRDGRLTFHEGCVIVTAPVGAPPEYITVMVDGINDPNVLWRGTPPAPGIGDVVIVWENTVSHRREIWSPGGAAGSAGMGVHDHSSAITGGQNLRQIQELEFDDATILTIDGAGSVTRTQVYHIIAANAGVADDLDNVFGGVEGDELIIRPDAGDTIAVRHNQGGAGDFWFAGGANIALDGQDHLRCVHDGTSWCDQSGGAGGALVIHDHFNAAAGGQDLNPERISTRTVLCGPGLPNTTLGAAVVRVNALGPPALNSEWTIMVLGRTTEAGAVTIPAYCHVVGMEEGSIVSMGANTLTVSDNAGLYNINVTSAANTVIYINNANPWLRNVHAGGTPGGTIFNIGGTSSPSLYDCIAEGTQDNTSYFYMTGTGSPKFYRCQAVRNGGSNPVGFSVQGACTPLLEHCIANDSTNFLYALIVANVAAVVTTRYCTLRAKAAGTDVNVGSAATWQDVASNYDADNLNVLGTFVALPQSPVNLDGRADALILDADGDTTISAPTDDQIDVEIAGADDFQIVANKLKVLTGSHVEFGETADPANVANAGLLYCKDDGAGNTELYYMDEAGNVSKLTPPGIGVHNILSAAHDATAVAAQVGDLQYRKLLVPNALWDRLGIGAAGTVLTSDGTHPAYAAPSYVPQNGIILWITSDT